MNKNQIELYNLLKERELQNIVKNQVDDKNNKLFGGKNTIGNQTNCNNSKQVDCDGCIFNKMCQTKY